MSTISNTPSHSAAAEVGRPRRRRWAGLAAAGVLATALPIIYPNNVTRMLLVGELSDHRFHQLTGQGLVLFALWLGGLVPLLRAGWSGRRPSSLAGLAITPSRCRERVERLVRTCRAPSDRPPCRRAGHLSVRSHETATRRPASRAAHQCVSVARRLAGSDRSDPA